MSKPDNMVLRAVRDSCGFHLEPVAAAPETALSHYRARIDMLVRAAAREGLVVAVEQRPLQPLAMGHYETVVHVRPGHKSYRSKG